MKDVFVRVLAISPSLEILIAKHNDSQYFIADGEDITAIVSEVVGQDSWENLHEVRTLEMAYRLFERRRGRTVRIPKFEFSIVDSSKTHLEVLMSTLIDVWHLSPEKALAVSYEVDEVGSAVLGTYTYEQSACFGRMIDMICDQLDHEIKYRFDRVDPVHANMDVLDSILKDK